GSFSALGAAVAFGHPLTIITSFVAAPITSLNPLIAAGIVAKLVQAYVQKPNVRDFENVQEDVFSIKGYWKNKVTLIFLIILLENLGSILGTFIGGLDVVRLFFENL